MITALKPHILLLFASFLIGIFLAFKNYYCENIFIFTGLAGYLVSFLTSFLAFLGNREFFEKIAKFFYSLALFFLNIFLFNNLATLFLVLSRVYLANIMFLPSTFFLAFWFFSNIAFLFYYKKQKNFILLTASTISFILLHTFMLFSAKNKINIFYESFSDIFLFLYTGMFCFSFISLFLSGIIGILFLVQERAFKTKKIKASSKFFPSLENLDTLNHFTAIVGFPMYAIGFIASLFWTYGNADVSLHNNIREIIFLIIFLVYAFFLHTRTEHNEKRDKTRLALIGFPIYTVAFIGSLLWTYGTSEALFFDTLRQIIYLIIFIGYALLFHIRTEHELKGKKPALLVLVLCLISIISFIIIHYGFNSFSFF